MARRLPHDVPFGVAIVVAAVWYVPESRGGGVDGRLDVSGATLVTFGLAATTFALMGGGTSPLLIATAAAAGALALAAFVVVERRAAEPLLPLELFASRGLVSANVVTFAVYGALGGAYFLLVIHLQTTLGYSALEAGAATLPVTALLLALSSRSGALAQRIGPRLQLTVGPLTLGLGMLLFALIERGDSYLTAVLPAVIVFGLGLSAVLAPVTATALAAAGERYAGVASGLDNAVSRFAGVVAVAALPVVGGLSGRDFEEPEALAAGFPRAMVAAAACSALGGVVGALTIPRDALDRSV